MGALNAISALYGSTRAGQDWQDREMKQREADTLDTTRQFNLEQARVQAPMKNRALELELGTAERAERIEAENEPAKRKLFQTQLKLDQFKTEDQQEVMETMRNARNSGIRMMGAIQARNAQAFAEHAATAFPGVKIFNPRGYMDGDTIVIEGEDEKGNKLPPRRISPTKTDDGQIVPAWDHAGMLVNSTMNPVKFAEKQLEHRYKMDEEAAKQAGHGKAALAVERERGASHERVARTQAEGRETRRSEDDEYKERKIARQTLSDKFRAENPSSGIIPGYSSSADSALLGAAQRRAVKHIRDGAYGEEASDAAWNDVKLSYERANRIAQRHADEITAAAEKAGSAIDFRNPAALDKAANEGNASAMNLKKALDAVQKDLGVGARQHLQKSLKINKPKS